MKFEEVYDKSKKLFEEKFGEVRPITSSRGEIKTMKNSSRTFVLLGLEEFEKVNEYAGPLVHMLAKEYAKKVWDSYEQISSSKEETAKLLLSGVNLFSGWGLFEGPLYDEVGNIIIKVYNPFEKRVRSDKKSLFLLGFVKGVIERLADNKKFEIEEREFEADGVKGIEFLARFSG